MGGKGFLVPCKGVEQWASAMLHVPPSSLPLPRGSFLLKNPKNVHIWRVSLLRQGERCWDPVNPSSLNKGINQSGVKHYGRNINSG